VLPLVLVPTNTTRTAAYVAVATNVSALDTRTPKDSINAKRVTAMDTVTKLFVCDCPRVMTIIGTTRKTPPVKAMMKRTSLSTKIETLMGCFPSIYSCFRSVVRSSRENESREGKYRMKNLRIGSISWPASRK
jgi:hypothetical protein